MDMNVSVPSEAAQKREFDCNIKTAQGVQLVSSQRNEKYIQQNDSGDESRKIIDTGDDRCESDKLCSFREDNVIKEGSNCVLNGSGSDSTPEEYCRKVCLSNKISAQFCLGEGGLKDASSFGGGETSVGGISESGLGVSFSGELGNRDRMFSCVPQHSTTIGMYGMAVLDPDRVDRVLEVTSFPNAMSYATSEAAKSDIATICSGSVVEDIEISSVMSGDMGPNQSTTQPVTPSSQFSLGRKKQHERDAQFSGDTSTMPNHNIYPMLRVSQTSLPFSQQHANLFRSSPPGSTSSSINNMGPPLSRSLLLERAGVLTSGLNYTGISSRTGSVRSFGSQAPSDIVHVDTDDCGGSLVESEGRGSAIEETHSVQHIYSEAIETSDTYGQSGERPHDFSKNNTSDKLAEKSMNGEPCAKNDELLRDRLSGPHSNGRTSPGGTVYKGKGVRRYRGRYFDLPLKRFHHNGVTISLPNEYAGVDGIINNVGEPFDSINGANNKSSTSMSSQYPENVNFSRYQRHRNSWSRRKSCSRSRSRSRERTDDHCRRKWSRGGRSTSPSSRPYYNRNREDRNRGKSWNIGNGDRCRGWNGGEGTGYSRVDASASWHRNNSYRKGGYHRGHQRSNSLSRDKMTPREARHHRDRRRW